MIRLLIVDDEKNTREGLKNYINWTSIGIDEVFTAEDGQRALELAAKIKPDILLTDIRMPVMNGIELASHIRCNFPSCKIVFLSAYSDKEYLKSAIRYQAVDYIEKPIDLQNVENILKQAAELCKNERNVKAQLEKLDVTINESMHLLKEHMAIYLTSPVKENDLWERLSVVNILPDFSSFFVTSTLIINIPSDSLDLFPEIRKSQILQAIECEAASFSYTILAGFKNQRTLVIHIKGQNIIDYDKVKQFLLRVKSCLDNVAGRNIPVFIGVGTMEKELSFLYRSYQYSVISAKRNFFHHNNSIIFYDNKPRNTFKFEEHLVSKFNQLLEQGNQFETIRWIKSIVSEIRKCENTLENEIRNFFFKILLCLYNTSDYMNLQIFNHENREDNLWQIILSFNTLFDIEAYMIDLVQKFFAHMEERGNKGTLSYAIVTYIEKNYMNKNLSIKSIADALGLTPNYLSLVFKKETGTTINSYIIDYRIKKAKELLRDQRVKLYEIATNVGFSDASYFAKIFKKIVGLNPSEYREKYS